MNRRHVVLRAAQVSALTALPAVRAAELRKPSQAETESIRAIAEGFLGEQEIPGLSIAYCREGDVAFAMGVGFADAEGKEPVTPEHRFRIASVSKPITSASVMMSVENGLLTLESKVFGPQGILREDYGTNLPERVLAVTVDHLLTHTSGGWTNDKEDPMFLNPAMKHDELIAWTLANQKQTHAPGEHYAYSNFGYCVLGRVLEKVTKLTYETLITQHVLSKCGVTGMKIAGNTRAESQPHEVSYITDTPEAAYKLNVARMDSHGGWIATAGELVLFASQLEKKTGQRGLITQKSIRTMTTAGTMNSTYARGWSVNTAGHWWHSGSLPGTTSILVHTAGGLCWAGLLNGRKEGTGLALDKLMWQIGRVVKDWNL